LCIEKLPYNSIAPFITPLENHQNQNRCLRTPRHAAVWGPAPSIRREQREGNTRRLQGAITRNRTAAQPTTRAGPAPPAPAGTAPPGGRRLRARRGLPRCCSGSGLRRCARLRAPAGLTAAPPGVRCACAQVTLRVLVSKYCYRTWNRKQVECGASADK